MLVAVNDKAQGRELARAVAHHLVLGGCLKAKESISEIKSLQTSKAGPNAQVYFLADPYGLSQVSIRISQVLDCSLYVLFC